jgi:zinc D-Ala-D-Ala carboxypeptidase
MEDTIYNTRKQTHRKRKGKLRLRRFIVFSIFIIFIVLGFKFITVVFNNFYPNIKNLISDNEIALRVLDKTPSISIDTNEWNMILVNPWNELPDNFDVERITLKNGQSIDKRTYPDLQDMLEDARGEGLSPIICSSYRTREKQESLFINKIQACLSQGYSQKEAEIEAARWIAAPGTSEHQTGLAVDIVSRSYQHLDEEQENTPEQRWLMENSYKYGFILRYPKDKADFTGIAYEPWHYRYVGKEAAKTIFEKKICFEEYLNSINEDAYQSYKNLM